MTTLPAAGYFIDAARTNAEAKTAQDDTLAFIRELGGGNVESGLTIAIGVVTPISATHSIDTEAAAATDDLTNILTTNLSDGAYLLIHAQNAARDIVVKHLAGGAGQIALATNVDFTLNDVDKWLFLKRTGADWEELFRSYGNDQAAYRTYIGLGTAAVLNVGTSASQVVQLDGSAKLPAVDGSALTGLATGASTAERTNILRNSFRIAVNGGLSVLSLVNADTDEFNNQTSTSVDVAGSTNATYDSTNKLYTNQAQTLIAQATGTAFGDMTASGGLPAAFDGVTSQTAANSANPAAATIVAYIGKDWGIGVSKTVTGFKTWGTSDVGFQGAADPTITITLYGSNTAPTSSNNGTALGSASATDANGLLISALTGMTVTTAYRYHWLEIAQNAAAAGIYTAEVEFYESPTANMTLQSVAITALAQPATILGVIREEDIDAITLGTDLTLEVSRDGGTTWTAVTLTEVATDGTGRILQGSADVSAQPAGTSLKWRVKTLNLKASKILALAIDWG